mmetsp:Transcript_4777/g.7654  ORF Transcript_4777/g.7654 Transcript_4777/m.7654 type:complete len:116 (+) Transcript_4777:3-350(+)
MMKKFNLKASDVISWLRICRPGSVIGPQQQWLERYEEYLHESSSSKLSELSMPDNGLFVSSGAGLFEQLLSQQLAKQVQSGTSNRARSIFRGYDKDMTSTGKESLVPTTTVEIGG